MSGTIEIAGGQSASLPEIAFLRVRVTGAAEGVVLKAVTVNNENIESSSATAGHIDLRPNANFGTIRLIASPSYGDFFELGSRVGLEFLAGAGAKDSNHPILVSHRDVGAFQSIELAQCEFHDVHGWTVTASGTRGASVETPGAPEVAASAIDERAYPWVRTGRYAVRQSERSTAVLREYAAKPWALLVDSSASMRTLFDRDSLGAAVEYVAGVFAEASGQLPDLVGLTGSKNVDWKPDLIGNPGGLAHLVVDSTRPASWFLCAESIQYAYQEGIRAVVILSDAVPADIEKINELTVRLSDLTIAILSVKTTRATGPVAHMPATDMNPVFGVPETKTVRVHHACLDFDTVLALDDKALATCAGQLLGGVE